MPYSQQTSVPIGGVPVRDARTIRNMRILHDETPNSENARLQANLRDLSNESETLKRSVLELTNTLKIIVNKRQIAEQRVQSYEVFFEMQSRAEAAQLLRVEDLQEDLQQRDEILAYLYLQIMMRDNKLAHATELIQEYRKRRIAQPKSCDCCFELIPPNQPTVCCSAKANTHTFCTECIDSQCSVMLRAVSRAPVCTLACMSCEDCDQIIESHELCKSRKGTYLVKEFHQHDFVDRIAQVAQNTLSEAHSEAKSFYDALLYRLAFLRSDGSFRAYQCAHCGHGPIVHKDCDDLRAHHGQPSEEGESINNACPRCDNFVKNVNSMQPWDGSYSHVQTVRP